MHYGNYAFSSNGQATIVAKSGVPLREAYQKSHITDLDVAAIRRIYNCKLFNYYHLLYNL